MPVLAVAGACFLSACGGAASGANSASPSPRGNGFNGASGQLVQINGQTLIVTGPNGDLTVTYTTTTTFTKTSIATLADVVSGACIFATGPKDSTGVVQASAITITPADPSGTCTTGIGGRRGGGFPGGGGNGG